MVFTGVVIIAPALYEYLLTDQQKLQVDQYLSHLGTKLRGKKSSSFVRFDRAKGMPPATDDVANVQGNKAIAVMIKAAEAPPVVNVPHHRAVRGDGGAF